MKKLVSWGILLLLLFSMCSSVLALTEEGAVTEATVVEKQQSVEGAEKAAAKLKKVTISPSAFTLAPGKKKQLAVKKTPSNASLFSKSSWESSDKKVATVDKKGKVTAKKAGVAVIFYSSWNPKDDREYVYASALCYVSKKAPKAAKISKSDLKITVKGKTISPSSTYAQIKKLLPGGRATEKTFKIGGKRIPTIVYIVEDVGYDFVFYKSNKRLMSVSCHEETRLKAPRGIVLGSTKTSAIIEKYGYPSAIEEGKGNLTEGGIYLIYNATVGGEKYQWVFATDDYTGKVVGFQLSSRKNGTFSYYY